MLLRRAAAALAILALLLVAGFVVEQRWLLPVTVNGVSMEPAEQPGDRLLIDRRVAFSSLHKGDVIVFRARSARSGQRFSAGALPDALLVKRVAAAPGTRVDTPSGSVSLGRNEVWVLGDNAPQSLDSRSFGPVPRSVYVGRDLGRYWPLGRWTL